MGTLHINFYHAVSFCAMYVMNKKVVSAPVILR